MIRTIVEFWVDNRRQASTHVYTTFKLKLYLLSSMNLVIVRKTSSWMESAKEKEKTGL